MVLRIYLDVIKWNQENDKEKTSERLFPGVGGGRLWMGEHNMAIVVSIPAFLSDVG